MPGIYEVFDKYFRPHYFRLFVVVLLLIFAYAAYYGYTQFYSKRASSFSDVANSGNGTNGSTVIIYMFHVDWCPHCKHAMPEWSKFVAQYDGKEVNGYRIQCTDVNCTNETSEVTTLINQYSIESYPTVKMIKDDKTIEFDSKISSNALEQFVNTMTN
jgi:thiol-disulfide isomerase/thioredoxin